MISISKFYDFVLKAMCKDPVKEFMFKNAFSIDGKIVTTDGKRLYAMEITESILPQGKYKFIAKTKENIIFETMPDDPNFAKSIVKVLNIPHQNTSVYTLKLSDVNKNDYYTLTTEYIKFYKKTNIVINWEHFIDLVGYDWDVFLEKDNNNAGQAVEFKSDTICAIIMSIAIEEVEQ